MKPESAKEEAESLLAELDAIARERCGYDYGLPIGADDGFHERMVDAVLRRLSPPATTPSEMTDEAFGRAWAAQMGRAPREREFGGWLWAAALGFVPVATENLPLALNVAVGNGQVGVHIFRSEEAAYAALGKAVRAVHAAVPRLGGS